MTQWSTKLTERHEWLGAQIIVIAIKVHKALGPGLLEGVYEKCFCHELAERKIPYTRQKPVRINYEEIVLDDALGLDVLVDDLVVVEFKAQEISNPVWQAQLLSYLRLTDKRLGYILNFHVPLMKEGIKRMIL
jgi:GxxExxY protein